MKTIAVPPGYRVELVAKEPMVLDPILAEFDADGRMWVLEMPGFAMNMAMADSREPICRVVVLEDTNDDGTMDRRTVFADGLVLPRAIKPVDGRLPCEAIGLHLERDGNQLRLWDPVAGRRIPTPAEARQAAESGQKKVEAENERLRREIKELKRKQQGS